MKLRWSVFVVEPAGLIPGDVFGIHHVLARTWWEARVEAADALNTMADVDGLHLRPGSRLLLVVRARSLR